MKNIEEHVFGNKVIKGVNVSRGDAAELVDFMETQHERIEDIEEIEKSPEDLKFIDKFNEYLKKEFTGLGLEFNSVIAEKIKFVSPENFKKIHPNNRAAGFYSANNDIIVIKYFSSGSDYTYKRMVHEMIHAASFHMIRFNAEDQEYNVLRSGYDYKKFRGFNEGLTEIIAVKILTQNKNELINEMGVFDGLTDASPYTEMRKEDFFSTKNDHYDSFVEMMIFKMAQKSRRSKDEILKKFEEGMFSGNMMQLREVEKIFGKNALRILSMHGCVNKRTDDIVYDFFFEDDPIKKKKIEEALLLPSKESAS